MNDITLFEFATIFHQLLHTKHYYLRRQTFPFHSTLHVLLPIIKNLMRQSVANFHSRLSGLICTDIRIAVLIRIL